MPDYRENRSPLGRSSFCRLRCGHGRAGIVRRRRSQFEPHLVRQRSRRVRRRVQRGNAWRSKYYVNHLWRHVHDGDVGHGEPVPRVRRVSTDQPGNRGADGHGNSRRIVATRPGAVRGLHDGSRPIHPGGHTSNGSQHKQYHSQRHRP